MANYKLGEISTQADDSVDKAKSKARAKEILEENC